ncbi:hypothetical protein KSX_05230 [Ktedonospora formicarum]|uniref:Protein kinase domain-containing protein n=2 Tax=Ktedonospora formicarum TaxID=2778364 RepID=A0A8J3HWL3_9CHLR|nr:hypothetical protein KSX_05230 [Ktedonospora formicarum]
MLVRLDHPGIIRVLEFGIDEQGEATYLAMQYAAQGTVRQRYPRGSRLPLTVVRAYIESIASALYYAHERKIVHRDVKPENLLLSKEGKVLLSDFGIAVVASSARLGSNVENVAGTLSYIAPEQLQGSPCTASDQYALGIVIYEWLCGRTPFRGSSTEIMAKHLFATPPSLRKLISNMPEELEQVIIRALAKQPNARFASVKAFADAFLWASEGISEWNVADGGAEDDDAAHIDYGTVFGQSFTDISSTPPSSAHPPVNAPQQAALMSQKTLTLEARDKPRPTRRALLAGGAGLAAALGAGSVGGLWYWHGISASSTKNPPKSEPPTKPPLTGDMVYVYRRARQSVDEALWLPNSKRVLTLLDNSDIYVWDAESGAHEQLIFPGPKYRGEVVLKENSPVGLSPDGTQLALVTTDGVLIGSLGADTYDTLTNPEYLIALWWAPRGSMLAVLSEQGFELWDTQARKKVYVSDSDLLSSILNNPKRICWSPDGRSIASMTTIVTVDDSVIIWSAEAGSYGERIAALERVGSSVQALAWSPDGKQLVISQTRESLQVWDIASRAPAFTCEQGGLGPEIISWSPNGDYVLGAASSSQNNGLKKDTNLYVWRMRKSQEHRPGSLLKTYKGHQQTILTASWSSDSRYIISGSGRGEYPDNQVIDASARIWRVPI